MKKFFGHTVYVQSVGVKADLEIDGFTIAVCLEIGVDLHRHRARSFQELQDWGEDLGAFDLAIALTPASYHRALELTRHSAIEVEHWPIADPTGLGEGREARLAHYRATRDQIAAHIRARFGQPLHP